MKGEEEGAEGEEGKGMQGRRVMSLEILSHVLGLREWGVWCGVWGGGFRVDLALVCLALGAEPVPAWDLLLPDCGFRDGARFGVHDLPFRVDRSDSTENKW